MGVGAETRPTGSESHPDDSGDQNRKADWTERESSDLSDSEIFDILRNSRRRAVISLLRGEDSLSITSLTRQVAAREYDVDPEDLSSEQHKRVYTGLYQCHLPRLDDTGIIDFDKETKTVSLQEAASQVEQYLYQSENTSTARIELGTATVVASVVSLGTMGVGPLGGLPAITWAMFTVAALLGFALFQLYVARGPR